MDAREVKDAIEELEPKVERLRALYKQYFMGFEKIPPLVLRKDVDRTIYRLRRARFNQTRLKFKFNQIVARYNTYSQFWARTMREIERGTYKRHIRRAAQRMGSEDALAAVGRAARAALRAEVEEMPATPTWTLDPDDGDAPASLSQMPEFAGAIVSPNGSKSDDENDPLKGRVRRQSFGTLDLGPLPSEDEMGTSEPAPPPEPVEAPAPPPEAKTRAMPPPPKRPPPKRPPPKRPPPGRPPPPKREEPAADHRHRAVYQEYLKARRAAGNSTDVSYDKVATTLEQQASRIRAKHGNRDIDFKVVTKDGKAVIRPVLKK